MCVCMCVSLSFKLITIYCCCQCHFILICFKHLALQTDNCVCVTLDLLVAVQLLYSVARIPVAASCFFHVSSLDVLSVCVFSSLNFFPLLFLHINCFYSRSPSLFSLLIFLKPKRHIYKYIVLCSLLLLHCYVIF